VQQVGIEYCAGVSLLLSALKEGKVAHIIEANKLVYKVKHQANRKMIIHPLHQPDMVVIAWADAAYANGVDGTRKKKGIFIGVGPKELLQGAECPVTPVFWQSAKIDRVCRSSGCSETRAVVDAEDELFAIRYQWSEMMGHNPNLREPDDHVKKVVGVVVTDSRNVYDKMQKTMITPKGAEKRADIEILCLKEAEQYSGTILRWVHSDAQLANSLTKADQPWQISLFYKMSSRWKIVYDPNMTSAKKRKAQGITAMQGEVNDNEQNNQPNNECV
jgi:hypothetical protein